jgi:hypothetical protein
MFQKLLKFIAASALLSPLILLGVYGHWLELANFILVYFVVLCSVFYLLTQINSQQAQTNEISISGSLFDPVVTDYGEIQFEKTPLSFQQLNMYRVLTEEKDSTIRADDYTLRLSFLHARAIIKNIPFRNFPLEELEFLIKKAYDSASGGKLESNLEFENTEIFDEE